MRSCMYVNGSTDAGAAPGSGAVRAAHCSAVDATRNLRAYRRSV